MFLYSSSAFSGSCVVQWLLCWNIQFSRDFSIYCKHTSFFFLFHSQYDLCYLRPSKSFLSQQPFSVGCQSLTFSQQCLDPTIFFILPLESYCSESLRNGSKWNRVCSSQNDRWMTFGKDWQLGGDVRKHRCSHSLNSAQGAWKRWTDRLPWLC